MDRTLERFQLNSHYQGSTDGESDEGSDEEGDYKYISEFAEKVEQHKVNSAEDLNAVLLRYLEDHSATGGDFSDISPWGPGALGHFGGPRSGSSFDFSHHGEEGLSGLEQHGGLSDFGGPGSGPSFDFGHHGEEGLSGLERHGGFGGLGPDDLGPRGTAYLDRVMHHGGGPTGRFTVASEQPSDLGSRQSPQRFNALNPAHMEQFSSEISKLSKLLQADGISEKTIEELEAILQDVKTKLQALKEDYNSDEFNYSGIDRDLEVFQLLIHEKSMCDTSIGSVLEFYKEFQDDFSHDQKVELCDKLMSKFKDDGFSKKEIIVALKSKLESELSPPLKLFFEMILEYIPIEFNDFLNKDDDFKVIFRVELSRVEVAKRIFGNELYEKYVMYKIDPKLLKSRNLLDLYYCGLVKPIDVQQQYEAIYAYRLNAEHLEPKYRRLIVEFENDLGVLFNQLDKKRTVFRNEEAKQPYQPFKPMPKAKTVAVDARNNLKKLLLVQPEEAIKKELLQLFVETPLNVKSKDELSEIKTLIMEIKRIEQKGFYSGNVEKSALESKELELGCRLKLIEFDYSKKQNLEAKIAALRELNNHINKYLNEAKKIIKAKESAVVKKAASAPIGGSSGRPNLFAGGLNPFAEQRAKMFGKKKDGSSGTTKRELQNRLSDILSQAVHVISTTSSFKHITILINKNHPPISLKKDLFSEQKLNELDAALQAHDQQRVVLDDGTELIFDGGAEERRLFLLGLFQKRTLPILRRNLPP